MDLQWTQAFFLLQQTALSTVNLRDSNQDKHRSPVSHKAQAPEATNQADDHLLYSEQVLCWFLPEYPPNTHGIVQEFLFLNSRLQAHSAKFLFPLQVHLFLYLFYAQEGSLFPVSSRLSHFFYAGG